MKVYRCNNEWLVGYVDQGEIALTWPGARLSIDEVYADVA